MVVIVPSGEFFTKTKNKKRKKLGLTSTYKYKTIHTSVWMLLRDGGGKNRGKSISSLSLLAPRVLAASRQVVEGR